MRLITDEMAGRQALASSRVPLKCHSRTVKYSVLNSKNSHNLEPPYGIEP